MYKYMKRVISQRKVKMYKRKRKFSEKLYE